MLPTKIPTQYKGVFLAGRLQPGACLARALQIKVQREPFPLLKPAVGPRVKRDLWEVTGHIDIPMLDTRTGHARGNFMWRV